MNSLSNNLLTTIKTLLDQARKQVVQTVNITMVKTYFEIGKMIVEDEQNGENRAEYGKETLKNLSAELTKEYGKGFTKRNLELMRQFYLVYSKTNTLYSQLEKPSTLSRTSDIQQTVSAKSPNFNLSWSHYLILMRMEEVERAFYEKEISLGNWSVRQFQRQIDSGLFERIALSRDKNKILEDSLQKYHEPENSTDIVKDPLILEFLGLEEKSEYSESELEKTIISKIEHFLLEIGKGFAFVGRQQRFTFEEEYFFVDLVFYNRLLKCFVLVDLKIGKLKHQDLGQMQMYVNYYDRFVKIDEENPTIGIVLCKDKKDSMVEITLPENSQIFASKYQLYLPNKEELKRQIEDKNF
jgi:predicted nuclease of restriction endonuclease-like (RecB) superfamily